MYSVIVIDDSKLMQRLLSDIINAMDDFTVIDTASDAFEARDKIKQHEPDIVTIDINMPKMDGVTFLRNLMRLHPMPAIVVSTDVSKHTEVFDDGAIGFVPKAGEKVTQAQFERKLTETLMSLTYLLRRYQRKKVTMKTPNQSADATEIETVRYHPDELLTSNPALLGGKKVVAIGASTGGVEALMRVFEKLPSQCAPIVITLHIPYGFSKSFSERLNKISQIHVKEAEDGDILRSGHALLAPGNRHLTIQKNEKAEYCIRLLDGVRISRHKPSVDIMFRSVNNLTGRNALGIIMTGMGDDGVVGLCELYQSGAQTLAQDEKTCVVYGMPKKAVEANCVKEVVPLDKIAIRISEFGI